MASRCPAQNNDLRLRQRPARDQRGEVTWRLAAAYCGMNGTIAPLAPMTARAAAVTERAAVMTDPSGPPTFPCNSIS
jgi:hypothetical protein